MESRVCLVFLLLQLCILGSRCAEATIGRHQHDSNAIPSPAHQAAEREHILLIECQNSDYRTYIKCLKREKRQHHPLGNTRCLDECLSLDHNCTTSSCIRECHSHCKKRLIETYSKTVETSFDCTDDSCTENSGSKTPNITNIININHIPSNCTNASEKDGKDGSGKDGKDGDGKDGKDGGGKDGKDGGGKDGQDGGGKDGKDGSGKDGKDGGKGKGDGTDSSSTVVVPRIDIHNEIINNPSPNCGCPGCNCNSYNPYNSWQPMPQITIGFGGGPTGGCMFPISWPCFQRYPTQTIDCSICANPFLRNRCDPGCYPDPNVINRRGGTNGSNATAQSIHTTTQRPIQPNSYPRRS